MNEDLKIALSGSQEMDAYLEAHTGQEIIDHIMAALADSYDLGVHAALSSEMER